MNHALHREQAKAKLTALPRRRRQHVAELAETIFANMTALFKCEQG